MKRQAAVIFGGISSEHEVSCSSVLNVLSGFDEDKYELTLIGITKEGKWLLTDSAASIEDGTWKNSTRTAILSPDRGRPGVLVLEEDTYTYKKIDVIFPVLHGRFGEDGTILRRDL